MDLELIERVSKEVDSIDVVDLLRSLVRIPSVKEEYDIAVFIAEKAKSIGLDVMMQEVEKRRPNVICKLKGSGRGKSLILQGHMDTVPPDKMEVDPFAAEMIDGKVYGRGAVDMKGGLTAMLVAAEAIQRLGLDLKGDIFLAFTVDEESEKKGIFKLVETGLKADMGICCEPTSMDIQVGQKGNVYITITTKGKRVHAATPEKGINAIYKMAKVLEAIQRFEPASCEVEGVGKIYSTISVGVIQGGSLENFMSVPDICKIWVDRRLVPGESREDFLGKVKKMLEEIGEKDKDFKAEFKVERPDQRPEAKIIERGQKPTLVSPKEAIVGILREAFMRITGRDPRISFMNAWTEADFLVNDLKIPTVIFGPGRMELSHSPNEHIEVKDVITAAKIYALTMLKVTTI